MAAGQIVMRAKYKSTIKSPGIDGILKLTEKKFMFAPNDPTTTLKLDVDFKLIKGHKFTKEGSHKQALLNLTQDAETKGGSYIFEFRSFADRDTCREFVARVLSFFGGTSNSDAERLATSTPEDGNLSANEMERRMKLLHEDVELQKLHKQFVLGGILSETEFWVTRKKLLHNESVNTSKQRTGFKSSMISDVKPSTDGRTNRVTFSLTPEIIHQIFAEKPAVHKAFFDFVPRKMTEKDFWGKYFRAEYLHSTRNSIAAAAEAAEDEELAVFLKHDDILANEVRRKLRRVDPTLDIDADDGDRCNHLQNEGYISTETTEPQHEQYKRSLSHDLNRHSTVVLEGRPFDAEKRDTRAVAEALAKSKEAGIVADTADTPNGQDRPEKIRRVIGIDDLQKPHQHPVAPLFIKDHRDYFDTQQANAIKGMGVGKTQSKCILNTKGAYTCMRRFISDVGDAGSDPIVAPDVALKVFTELTQSISGTKFYSGSESQDNILSRLPPSLRDELMHQWTSIQELLRHFWSSYPITNAYLYNKVGRLKDAMSNIYPKLQEVKALQSDFRHQVSLLVQPMLQALDAAFAQYEADMQKRREKKENGFT